MGVRLAATPTLGLPWVPWSFHGSQASDLWCLAHTHGCYVGCLGGVGAMCGIHRCSLCRIITSLSHDPMQYDLSVSTYSPDGKVFQTEYAQKAVDNSGCDSTWGGLLRLFGGHSILAYMIKLRRWSGCWFGCCIARWCGRWFMLAGNQLYQGCSTAEACCEDC